MPSPHRAPSTPPPGIRADGGSRASRRFTEMNHEMMTARMAFLERGAGRPIGG
jgi:hypothetical protein